MNGEISIIAILVDAGGVVATVGVLWWAVTRLSSGELISRKMHDEILDVYRTEAKKLTNGMEAALKELKDAADHADERTTATRGEMMKVTEQIVDGLNRIERAIKENGGTH